MASSSPRKLIAPDLVLLLLAAEKEGVNGVTRLEKLLYLAGREGGLPGDVTGFFEFVPYNFGPYSKAVYDAIETLEEFGLVSETRVFQGVALDEQEEADTDAIDEEGVERRFALTEKGRAIARLLSATHVEIASKLRDIKARYGRLNLQELLRYVYTTYPDAAIHSTIRDRVLGERV